MTAWTQRDRSTLLAAITPMFIMSAVVMVASTCFGASLEDYQRRIEQAAIIAESFSEAESPAASVSQIRKLIPVSEKVEWPRGAVETDNRWLSTELDALARETDPAQSLDRAEAIGERLKAMAEKIEKLRQAGTTEPTKDEDKRKLGEILRREEFQKPAAPEESLFQRWYRAVMEWLSRVFPRPELSEASSSGMGSFAYFLQLLLYALVIGAAAFALYKLSPIVAGRFGWLRKEGVMSRVVLGEHVADDQTAEGLFGEAERLASEGRLRDAIRKGYIAALCQLADRRIVRLAGHKTNRDYLRDVRRSRLPLFEQMARLTSIYEQNWYGGRTSDPVDWEDFREWYRRTMADA